MYKTTVKSETQEDGIQIVFTEIDIDFKEEFVAFIDVLGFREMVLSSNQESKSKLKNYFNVISYFKSELKKIAPKSSIKALAVSDSLILSMPIESGDDELEKLKHLCIAIGLIQNHLMMNDIWIRGAITKGKVAHRPDESFILGPAYVRAYELEQKVAIFPRVILDSELISFLNLDTSQDLIENINRNTAFDNWNGNILFDWGKAHSFSAKIKQDTPLFIDYFQKLFEVTGAANERRNTNSRLFTAKLIQENIKNRIETYEKFRWIADYYISKYRMQQIFDRDEEAFRLLTRL